MATTTSSPAPSPNPNASIEGNLTLALPAPTASGPTPPPMSSSSGRRFPAPCWTHEETLALIDSYRNKWLSLRRGNLRATHWQEVADAVASRCQHLLGSIPPGTSLKTSVQCRHKIEKLRKRYRVERQRSLRLDPTSPAHSSWVFFRIMDGMDINGGAASSAAKNMPPQLPFAVASRSSSSSSLEDSSSSADTGEEEDEDEDGSNNSMVNGKNRAPANGFRFKIPKTNQVYNERPMLMPTTNFANGRRFREKFNYPEMAEKRRREKKEQKGGGGSGGGGGDVDGEDVVGEIAAAVRVLGEGIMRIERMKLDMSREFEKARIEMELKRTEMLLDLHRRIVDGFVAGIAGSKKKKRRANMSGQ